MEKTVLFRLFGLGGIPKGLRAELEAEDIVVADEGLGGWLVERNLRAPRRRSLYKIRSFTGFLAVTKKRVLAYTYWTPQVELPVGDPRLSALHVSSPMPRRLTLSFDYEALRPDWHGNVELRFKTARAPAFYEVFTALGAQSDGAGFSVQRGVL